MPAYVTPRSTARRWNVTGTISARKPTAGSAYRYVVGWVQAKRNQTAIPSLPPKIARPWRWSTNRYTSVPTITGTSRISPTAAIRAPHEKNGTRPSRIPGALVVSTDVATETEAAASPISRRAWAAMNRSTMSPSPPPGPPLLASATMMMTSPASQVQNPAIARRGKASARAPSCSGTIAMATPSRSGTRTPKSIPTRWAAKSWTIEPSSSSVPSPSMRSAPSSALRTVSGEQREERRADEQPADHLVVGRGHERGQARSRRRHGRRSPLGVPPGP